MAHWDELPAEIRLMIWEHVADSKPEFCGLKSLPKNQRAEPSLATLATVSREWQYYFETVTFSRLALRLDSNDFKSLSSAVTGTHREPLVRHISISVDDYGKWPFSDSSGALRLTRPVSLSKAMECLFLCLQKWQSSTHPGLTLELCVSYWQSLHGLPGQDAPAEGGWGRLPMAPVVTSLILPQREPPIMHGRQFRYLFAASPRLESFRWETSRRDFDPPFINRSIGREMENWVGAPPPETGLAFFQRLSSTVKSISLFSDERLFARFGEDSALSRFGCAEFYRWISMALARRDNTQLKHLSICLMTDASTLLDIALQIITHQEWEKGVLSSRLFRSDTRRPQRLAAARLCHEDAATRLRDAPVDHPNWERLETLTLKCTLLAPSSKEEEADAAAAQINGLILKAGQLAKRSLPKLRTLEIWNGANPSNTDPYFPYPRHWEGYGFIFRYTLSAPPPPPKIREENRNTMPTWRSSLALLEFKSSWHFTPSEEILAIWEEVAAMQTRQLKVSVEYVDGFKTGGCLAVMKELVTRKLVVSGQAWNQIQTNGITGPRAGPQVNFNHILYI
ncbi:hypothetical protein QBC37DRAFT_451055 [Rhypophila decipiens]|uniref:DUF6546 domain-containing protein n=1 Tax=Rhypophila decipiens TaxID=261697 RepID=A0AAN6YES1_9PEZI|nr:hypothetical protein QBC37DRAFT_451055 [Rhypophila decipiens]